MVSNRKPVLTLLYKEKRRPLHIPVQVCDNLHIPYVEVCALAHTPMVYVALLSFIEVAVRTEIELSEMSVSGTVGPNTVQRYDDFMRIQKVSEEKCLLSSFINKL